MMILEVAVVVAGDLSYLRFLLYYFSMSCYYDKLSKRVLRYTLKPEVLNEEVFLSSDKGNLLF